jgi:hypothetical protein
MKTIGLLLLATATAAAAPACPRDKALPAEIPAVGCPQKVQAASKRGFVLTYGDSDGGLGAWREAFENAGWRVTATATTLTAKKGHDKATATFANRTVSLVFSPG